MLQLIPKQKIEEATKQFAEKRRFNSRGYPPTTWFESGVDFALKEVEPLIVELIQWTIAFGAHETFENKKTSKQLLQQFIEERNK